MHDLRDAKKALQELAKRGDLDASIKKHLIEIADAVGESEERLKALEAVVQELAVGAKLKSLRGGPMANSHRVAVLLGAHRG
jgi:hypothetical protein